MTIDIIKTNLKSPQYDVAIAGLREIVRLYERSNKRGRHTCDMMYKQAQKALYHIDLLAAEVSSEEQ